MSTGTMAERVEWRDLVKVSRTEALCELALPLPWLAISLFAASRGLWPLAWAASFMLFLTCLRVAHNAYHYAVGLPRRETEWLMFVMSLLMQCSAHAIKVTTCATTVIACSAKMSRR